MRRVKQTEPPYTGGDTGRVMTVRFRLPTLPKFLRRKRLQYTLPEPFGTDMRSLGPTHVCSCGCEVFNIMATFEDYEIVWYFLDGTCVNCGNIVKVPCPADDPNRV